MLQRKIDKILDNWAVKSKKKALFLEGARQVGKTTSIRALGHRHYKHFIEINFIKKPSAKRAFDGDLDANTIILNLSAMGFGPFLPGETLVFFDEIQECPNARASIKFLVEDGAYDYAESGSLLGIHYKGDENSEEEIGEIPSIPVGSEETVEMYPLDFEEFLMALGMTTEILGVLRHSYDTMKTVPDFIHEQVMRRYAQYLAVGGLPEVVSNFVENRDFTFTLKAQNDLISGYRKDISKYAGKDKVLVKRVFDSIPSQLAKQDKRFVLADLEHGASRRKYADPTQWLIDAGMAYYAIQTNALSLPLSNVENRRLYKLYLLDTGMLCNMSLPRQHFAVMNGNLDINEGALAENFVAAELVKKGYPLYYFDQKSKHELDFVLPGNEGIIILEVKSGGNYCKHASLDYVLQHDSTMISDAVVLCNSNVTTADRIHYLPLYMAMFM
ncbi:MAG: ATP-binding protein [Bacteroidales bacterium]|nr:ATP-binding protein [Bacteroidales bacterium]